MSNPTKKASLAISSFERLFRESSLPTEASKVANVLKEAERTDAREGLNWHLREDNRKGKA